MTNHIPMTNGQSRTAPDQRWSMVLGHLLFIGIWTLGIGGSVRADALAHGSPQMYWIAQTRPAEAGGVQTVIRQRLVGSGAPWQTIARINAHVVSLSNRGTQLVALLDNGDWMLLWPDGSSNGAVPEDGAKLIAMAGGDEVLWGVGAARLGRTPTTAGATQPASSQPSGMLLLYRLERGQWKMLAPLPAQAVIAKDADLAQTGRDLRLAVLLEDGQITTFQFDEKNQSWKPDGTIKAPAGATKVKLLAGLPRAALWAGAEKTPGAIYFRDADWSAPVPLALGAGELGDGVQDIAVAGTNIRLITAASGKFIEHSYSSGGISSGQVDLPAPETDDEPRQVEWLTAVGAAALMVVLLNSMRRRTPVSPEMLEDAGVRLAPFGLRLLAGTVDSLPMIGVVLAYCMSDGGADPTDIQRMWAAMQVPLYIAMGVYVAHTLISELIWGRTIGKKLCDLRVTTLAGAPPTAKAILLRNLLRVVDVVMFFPLLLVLISPLRQRVGDVAAETVVVIEGKGQKAEQ